MYILPNSHKSPVHPSVHAHVYDPGVLIQVALFWQPCVSDIHSSISKKSKYVLKPRCSVYEYGHFKDKFQFNSNTLHT